MLAISLSHRHRPIVVDLKKGTSRFTLKVSTDTTKMPSLTAYRTLSICINGQNIDNLYISVELFLSTASKNLMLFDVLTVLIGNIKWRLFRVNVLSVLIGESTIWKVTTTVTHRLVSELCQRCILAS